MSPLRCLMLSLALLSAASHAGVLPNDAARALIQQGNVLATQGRYQDAVQQFQAASRADPASSSPVAAIAHVLLLAADAQQGSNAATLRQQAEGAAHYALTLGADDPLAQEVLRLLADEKPAPLNMPSQAAWKLLQEGETLFQSNKPAEAVVKYEEAARIDPRYSTAMVYAGDCYFVQKNWPEAETRFRKATEIEPLNGQAWRFLSDALAWQNKWTASEAALLSGIAAHPSQLPTWNKLASLRGKQGYPLTALKLQRKAAVQLDSDTGKYDIKLDPAVASGADQRQADGAVWLMLALTESNLRAANRRQRQPDRPFAIELAAWQAAMKAADELSARDQVDLSDPALRTMRMLAKADQLETGLLLLAYKESWRPEFEAWKKEHPDGVRKFIDTYALRP